MSSDPVTSILSLGRTFAPPIAKSLGLSALSGLSSEEASTLIQKKITGRVQTGVFLNSQNKIDQLIACKHLLTDKQKQDILNALQAGGIVRIKPTKVQSGGFLGSLLASAGIPIAVDLIGKAITGKGAPQMTAPPQSKQVGKGSPQIGQPLPFIGTWEKTIGRGRKKKVKVCY